MPNTELGMQDQELESGKAWLKQEALSLGATKAEWGHSIDDFDRNQQALLLSLGEASAVCRFSEFDLRKVPGDENLASALKDRVRTTLSSLGRH
jgi:hypothetical protein